HAEIMSAEPQAGEAKQQPGSARYCHADGEGGEEIELIIHRAECHRISADAEERRLGDVDLSAIAEHDDEAEYADRVGRRLHEDVEVVALIWCEPGDDHGADDGEAPRRQPAPPARPVHPCV